MSYGRALSGQTSVNLSRYVTGKKLVIDAIYRRLTTPRGTLRGSEEAEQYGFDVTGLVGTSESDPRFLTAPEFIRNELLKDDRVADVDVSVAYADGRLQIDIVGVLRDEGETFSLVLTPGEAGVILGVVDV